MQKTNPRSCFAHIKPYVPGKPVEEVKRELPVQEVIKLASNENPLGPSPLAVQALAKILGNLNYYPDADCYYLRQALAEKLGVKPAQLVFGNGADELISLVCRAYINPGDEGVMPSPTFTEYEFALRLMDGHPRQVPLAGDSFAFDLEALLGAVTERTRLVFLCSPNNPTGNIVDREALEGFMQRLPAGVTLVLDEAYHEFVTDPRYHDSLQYIEEGKPVIALRTFSKIYGLAGLRVGYAVAPEEIAADLNRAREPFNVNMLAQAAARAALEDEQHLDKYRKVVEDGRRQLADGLARLGLRMLPTQANFCFFDVKADSREVFQRLLRHGVIVRRGDIFGCPTWLRVSFGTREQNERFLQALGEVLREMA